MKPEYFENPSKANKAAIAKAAVKSALYQANILGSPVRVSFIVRDVMSIFPDANYEEMSQLVVAEIQRQGGQVERI